MRMILLLILFCSSFLCGQDSMLLIKTKNDSASFRLSEIQKLNFVTDLTGLDGKMIIKTKNDSVNFELSEIRSLTFAPVDPTGIVDDKIITMFPQLLTLIRNFPNPSPGNMILEFELTKPGIVEIKITDNFGKAVRSFPMKYYEAGSHQIQFDGTDNLNERLSGGAYYYSVKADNVLLTNKVLIVK